MKPAARRRARECAVQALYSWQLSQNDIADVEYQFLAEREHYRLRRDAQALAQWNGETLPVDPLNDAVLSDDDWLELAGFAFAHRPLLTSLGCWCAWHCCYLRRTVKYTSGC